MPHLGYIYINKEMLPLSNKEKAVLPEIVEFTTYDFVYLELYKITPEGTLDEFLNEVPTGYNIGKHRYKTITTNLNNPEIWKDTEFHGIFTMFFLDGEIYFAFKVKFTDGKLISIILEKE